MEEIWELQKQLKEIQQEEILHRISERNIVEIIDKLKAKREFQLIHTISGKEYITPDQIQLEIRRELTFNNGVLDLHYGRKSLNVSEEVMNSIVERMLKADKKLRLINGNLMTDVHLDNICHEINGLLQEKSLLSLSELANSYDIPLAMLKEIILNRIPRIINAKMHADSIYTHMYVRRQTAIIRAKIRARSTPLLLNTLLTNEKIDESFLHSILDELKNTRQINGELKSGIFIPFSFAKTQERITNSFYEQNHFVEYSLLEKVQIPKIKRYLNEKYSNGVHLETVFANLSIVEELNSYILEANHNAKMINLHEYLPSSFTEGDLKAILHHCSNIGEGQIINSYFASEKFVEKCVSSLKTPAEEYAKVEGLRIEGERDTLEEYESPKQKRKKKAKGKRKQQQAEDEEESKVPKDLKIDVKIKTKDITKLLSKLNFLQEFDTSLIENLSKGLKEKIKKLYEICIQNYLEVRKESTKESHMDLNDEISNLQEKLDSLHDSLCILSQGKHKKANPEEEKRLHTTLSAYGFKWICTRLLNNILILCLKNNGVAIPASIESATQTLNHSTRNKLFMHLFPEQKNVLKELNLMLQKKDKDLNQFIQILISNKEQLALRFTLFDKKRKKALKNTLLFKSRAKLAELVKQNDDFFDVLFETAKLGCIHLSLLFADVMPEEQWAFDIMLSFLVIVSKPKDPVLLFMQKYSTKYQTYMQNVKKDKEGEMLSERETNEISKFLKKQQKYTEKILEIFQIE